MSENEKQLTPMMRQYFEIKNQHSDKIVMFRLGDFYEMFYDDAIEASRILQITLTKRGETPMCGIPHHQLNNYLGKLIRSGRRAAIVEQDEPAAKGKTLVSRSVSQIITPGTVLESSQLLAGRNNHVVSLNWTEKKGRSGFAAALMDISTGEIELRISEREISAAEIRSQIETWHPSEVLLPEGRERTPEFASLFEISSIMTSERADHLYHGPYSRQKLMSFWNLSSLKGLGIDSDEMSCGALYALIHYAGETQKTGDGFFRLPKVLSESQRMLLDASTIRNLELVRSLQDGSERGTLLHAVDETLTAMGGRLLRGRLVEPLTNADEICARLDQVSKLTAQTAGLASVRAKLKGIQDFERIASRLILGRISPKEMCALADAVSRSIELSSEINNLGVSLTLPQNLSGLRDMTEKIRAVMKEDPSNDINEGGYIQSSADTKLAAYDKVLHEGSGFLADLQARYIKETGITSLKIRFNDNTGYYIEVTKSNLGAVPSHFIRKQTMTGAERYTTDELSERQNLLIEAQENSNKLEAEIFARLRSECALQIESLRILSAWTAEADAAASFAQTALKHKWCKPELLSDGRTLIKDGRHPVVEMNLTTPFIPNDLEIGGGSSCLHIITGPNMAGKSTYLRQNALILLLAQCGSFVPAAAAQITPADRIFCRVGASDNLAQGESTFLVEMNETAGILSSAGSKSFIIMDEIGRGTSTYDGMALAGSIVEYLTSDTGKSPRTLFATHYHELTRLGGSSGIENYTVAVKDDGKKAVFLKKVVRGAADKSYGIHVAEMAGLPKKVLERAREILAELEKEKSANSAAKSGRQEAQIFFTDPVSDEILGELREFDADNTTPAAAHSLLTKLKKKLDL